jgi:MFS family permease
MGISEAFYVPAALALIADYHRGPTRSLATGVHMTGMMIGAGMGGWGGFVAEHHAWHTAFSVFGLLGVGYVVVLLFLLRDVPEGSRETPPVPAGNAVRLGEALGSLIRSPSFLLAFFYWGALGMLWTITGWMPTFLTEKFHLGQGMAGFSATGYLQGAAMVGVLLGGYWADVWSRTNPRARIHVPVLGLAIAGPALILVAHTDLLAVAILGLTLHGLTRAFTDANMMPVLCMIADPRYRATGYGMLNLCACFVGGMSIYLGGALRDSGIHLVHLFELAGASMLVCMVLLLLIRTGPAQVEAAARPAPRK